jgi:hypothetical protein
MLMRTPIVLAAMVSILAGCASLIEPEKPVPPPPPQCYSGDHGKYFDLGAKTSISGLEVICEKTADGKKAQWMGVRSKN